MAGKKRLAAFVLVGFTLLAAAGGGLYYLATSRGLTLALVPDNAADAEAVEAVRSRGAGPAASDLDAVASAWAPEATTDQQNAKNIQEHTNSAKFGAVGEIAAVPAVADRYSKYAVTPVSAHGSVSDASYPAEIPPADVETADDLAATEAMPIADATQGEAIVDGTADRDGLAPVARGQAPSDESSETVSVADVVDDDADAPRELAGDPAHSLEPLSPPSTAPSANDATQRARNAFRDHPTASASERYGSSRAAASRDLGAATRSNSAAVNPFATRATPKISAATTSQDTDASGLIETLPPVAADEPEPTVSAAAQADSSAPFENSASELQSNNASTSALPAATEQLPGNPSSRGMQQGALSSPGASVPAIGTSDSAVITGTGRPGEKGLEGPQQPTILIQKFAPEEIQVGKPAKFVVQVRNVGSQTADEVVIRDEVPQGTRLVNTSPTASLNGTQVAWQIGKLSAGDERTLEMQLMPLAEGDVGSVATVSYSAQASVKTRCTMPQLAVRMTAADKVMIGEQQRVKIELRNPGSGDATGVMLFENVPENVQHASGPALEFEIGTLRAGETRELELILTAVKAGKVVNVLTARAEGNLQVQQQVEFEVIAPALEVEVDGPERRYLERPATYEVRVDNPGTAPAHDVQIITKLPKGMRFVRANNMGEYDAASHAVYWSLAELPEAEDAKVELVTMPVETGPQTLEVETRAGQGLVDQARQQILVEGLAAIMFELHDLEDPIEVGGETGYEIRVVNQGTKAATNVQVAVKLPQGMQVVSAEGETQYNSQGGTVLFEPIPQLAPKADTLYKLHVQSLQAGDHRITVEVNTDDLAQPIRREESTRVFGDE